MKNEQAVIVNRLVHSFIYFMLSRYICIGLGIVIATPNICKTPNLALSQPAKVVKQSELHMQGNTSDVWSGTKCKPSST